MTLQQNVEYRLVVREVIANVQVNPSPFSPKSLLVNGAPKGIKVFAWGGFLFKIPWVPEEFLFKVERTLGYFKSTVEEDIKIPAVDLESLSVLSDLEKILWHLKYA